MIETDYMQILSTSRNLWSTSGYNYKGRHLCGRRESASLFVQWWFRGEANCRLSTIHPFLPKGSHWVVICSTWKPSIHISYCCNTTSLRVYYQIQGWSEGCEQQSVDWGWHLTDGKLLHILAELPPAHSALLEMIRCNCKSDQVALAGVRARSTTWIARLHMVHAKAKVILTPARPADLGLDESD